MRFPRKLARFNKVATNRVQGLWAPRLPPWAVVEHVGRRSGRTYRTPVLASVKWGRAVIALPYGDDADWVRNLRAADGGVLIRTGERLVAAAPRVVEGGDVPAGGGPIGVFARRVGRALVLDVVSADMVTRANAVMPTET